MSATTPKQSTDYMDANVVFTRIVRAVWPRDTAKLAARASGIPFHTIKNWLERNRRVPASAVLMLAHHPAVRAELQAFLEKLNNAERRLMAEIEGQGSLDLGAPPEAVRPVVVARRRPVRSSRQSFRPTLYAMRRSA